MKRREFITLLGGAAAAWPFAVRAQPGQTSQPPPNAVSDTPFLAADIGGSHRA